ncbi:MAG: hypothetical protein ACRDOI_03955 [Trebonia sp.]
MRVLPAALLVQDPGDDHLDLLVGDLPRRPRAGRVRQRLQPAFQVADPPLADRSRDTPVCSAILVSGMTPPCSAQASTIRARSASDRDAVLLRTSASSDARSPSQSSRGTSFGPGVSRAYSLQTYL